MITEVITAVFGGGITGLFGTLVTSTLNFFSQRSKNKHEQEMARIQIDLLRAQTEAQAKIIVTQVEGAVEIKDSIAFAKSQQYGNDNVFSSNWVEKMLEVKGWTSIFVHSTAYILIVLFGIVDFLKSLMRPGITLYMIAATTWITYTAWKMILESGEKVSIAKAISLYETVVIIIIYLTVSCITWWFGDRRVAKFLMRLNDGNYKPTTKNGDDEEPTF